MFLRKRELVDSINRDLGRARNKRDTLTSSVTALTAQIAELEVRLSAETERRERDRVASEIFAIKKRVRDRSSAFSIATAGIRNATEAAETIVPQASELNELLDAIATEVAQAIDGLLGRLDLQIEAVRAGNTAPELPQSLTGSAESPQISDRVHSLREWLPHKKPTKETPVESRCSTAAAWTPQHQALLLRTTLRDSRRNQTERCCDKVIEWTETCCKNILVWTVDLGRRRFSQQKRGCNYT
jgi:hypothetical protein